MIRLTLTIHVITRTMKHPLRPRWMTPCLISLLAASLHRTPYCCQGQSELPYYELTPMTENVTFRSSYCYLYEQVYQGNLDRRDGLRGRNLSVALFDYQLDPYTGGIDEGQISVKFLDELAHRAGFEWRNTYGVLESPNDGNNYTYDSLLVWGTKAYDVMGEYFVQNIERLEMGIDFVDTWYDGSLIMIMKKNKEAFQWFSFMKPFSWQVWILILFSTFAAGIFYYVIDYLDSRNRSTEMEASLSDHMFFAPFAFTGHSMYNPRTISTRLVAFSLCFMFLVLLAVYTANMATLLIVQGELAVVVNTIDDAIKAELTICAWETTATDNYLILNHKNAKRCPCSPESECAAALVRGDCQVYLAFASSWEVLKRSKDFNGDCRLDWVGRTVMSTGGSFTVQDNKEVCSKFLEDVLTLHMVDMQIDGTHQKIWDDYYRSISSHDCDTEDEDDTDDELYVSAKQIGSLFILHFGFMILALIIALVKYNRMPEEKKKKVAKELKSNPVNLKKSALVMGRKSMVLRKGIQSLCTELDNEKSDDIEFRIVVEEDFDQLDPQCIDKLDDNSTISPAYIDSSNTGLSERYKELSSSKGLSSEQSLMLENIQREQSLMLDNIQRMMLKANEVNKQKNV